MRHSKQYYLPDNPIKNYWKGTKSIHMPEGSSSETLISLGEA